MDFQSRRLYYPFWSNGHRIEVKFNEYQWATVVYFYHGGSPKWSSYRLYPVEKGEDKYGCFNRVLNLLREESTAQVFKKSA